MPRIFFCHCERIAAGRIPPDLNCFVAARLANDGRGRRRYPLSSMSS